MNEEMEVRMNRYMELMKLDFKTEDVKCDAKCDPDYLLPSLALPLEVYEDQQQPGEYLFEYILPLAVSPLTIFQMH